MFQIDTPGKCGAEKADLPCRGPGAGDKRSHEKRMRRNCHSRARLIPRRRGKVEAILGPWLTKCRLRATRMTADCHRASDRRAGFPLGLTMRTVSARKHDGDL